MPHPVRSAYWAARRLTGRRRLLFFTADPARLEAAPDAAGCAILTQGDAALAEALAGPRGQDPAAAAARWQQGHALVCIRDSAGRPLAWGWITAATDRPLVVPFEWGMALAVPPGQAFLWDFFTLPEARGRRLYPALLRTAALWCLGRGSGRVAIYCDAENIASRNGLRAALYRPAGAVTVRRFGPLYRLTRHDGAAWTWCARPLPLPPDDDSAADAAPRTTGLPHPS